MSLDYWRDAVAAALDDAGITLTNDITLTAIARSIEVSHDNYGMAHGHDCIPNPLSIEVRRLEDARKSDAVSEEKRVDTWRAALGRACNVNPRRLSICNNGQVEIL